MSITSGFFDSRNGDRKYNAEQMSDIFDGVITDGIFENVEGHFAVKEGTGMSVIVSPGRAWFKQTWTKNDRDYPITIEPSDLTLSRIDAVVLEVNKTFDVRANSIKIVKGTPGSSPNKPALTNTDNIGQYPLAYVTVDAGTRSITNSKIENAVGLSETPFVTAILETTDISELFNEWDGKFNEWFDNVQAQLEGNVATNLQNQINDVNLKVSGIESDVNDANKEIYSLIDTTRRIMLANAYEDLAPARPCAMYIEPFTDSSDISSNTGAPVYGNKLSYNAGVFQKQMSSDSNLGGESAHIAIGFRSLYYQTLESVSIKPYSSGSNTKTVTFELWTATYSNGAMTLKNKVQSLEKNVVWPGLSDLKFVSIDLGFPLDIGYYALILHQPSESSFYKFMYYGFEESISNLSTYKSAFSAVVSPSVSSGEQIQFSDDGTKGIKLKGTLIFSARTLSSAVVTSKLISMPYSATKAMVYMEVNTKKGLSFLLNNKQCTEVTSYSSTTVDGVSCIVLELETSLNNLKTLLWKLSFSGTNKILVFSIGIFYV